MSAPIPIVIAGVVFLWLQYWLTRKYPGASWLVGLSVLGAVAITTGGIVFQSLPLAVAAGVAWGSIPSDAAKESDR